MEIVYQNDFYFSVTYVSNYLSLGFIYKYQLWKGKTWTLLLPPDSRRKI